MSTDMPAYWPEILVQELRHIVRSSKFDFFIASDKLKNWWMSTASDITARDRGVSLENIDKASIVISSDTCRTEFARDYSNAPYRRDIFLSSTPVDDSKQVLVTNNTVEIKVPVTVNILPASAPISNDLESSETYEELMDRLERQDQENFRRKEEVFTKVAKILLMDKYLQDDAQASAHGHAIETSISSFKAKTPMDQEVRRAYEEGIAERQNRKLGRSALLAQRQERLQLEAQREALRRRFDADSEDAQGEIFTFSSSQTHNSPLKVAIPASSVTKFGGLKEESEETDALFAANAKVFERLRQEVQGSDAVFSANTTAGASLDKASASALQAIQQTNLLLPRIEDNGGADLTMGNFINSDDFEELLCNLEAEQALSAQEKTSLAPSTGSNADEDETDLGSILRILDEAARLSAEASAASAAKTNVNSSSESGLVRPKVMLKAGMGIASDPRMTKDTTSTSKAANEVVKTTQHEPLEHNSTAIRQTSNSTTSKPPTTARNGNQSARRSERRPEETSDGSEEEEGSDDDAWRNRRKTLKGRAEQRSTQAVTKSSAEGIKVPDVSIYGFGGAGTNAAAVNSRVNKAKKQDTKVQTTTERASDRVLSAPMADSTASSEGNSGSHDEEKSASVSPMSPTSSRTSVPLSSSLSPEMGGMWVDVPSPTPSSAKNASADKQELLPLPPSQYTDRQAVVEDSEDADEHNTRIPIIMPPKVEAAGILSDAARSRKPKGGKLLNVKKVAN